jgi:hypothetical protein
LFFSDERGIGKNSLANIRHLVKTNTIKKSWANSKKTIFSTQMGYLSVKKRELKILTLGQVTFNSFSTLIHGENNA